MQEKEMIGVKEPNTIPDVAIISDQQMILTSFTRKSKLQVKSLRQSLLYRENQRH